MLKQKLALSYISKIILQFLQFGVTIIVARIAGPSVLGTVAFGTSFVSLFLIFFNLGQGVAHIKLISEGEDEIKCNGVFFRIQLLLSLVFFVLCIGFFLLNNYYNTFESSIHEEVILITIFTVSISNLFSIPRTYFNAKVEQAKTDIPDVLRQVIYQALRLFVVLLGYGAVAISLSNLTATILIIPFYIYLSRDLKWGKWDKILFKKYVVIAFPVFITNITDILLSNSDKVLLQYYYNSTEVGYYIAGLSIGGLITLIGNSAGLVLFPVLSKNFSENNYEKIKLIIGKFEQFTWLFIFPIVLVMSLGSDLIVQLFLGQKYSRSIPVFTIISFSSFLTTFFIIYGVILSSKGYFKLNARIYIMKLIFFLASAFLLIHPSLFFLGSKGIAFSLLLSNLFTGLIFIYNVKKYVREVIILSSYKIIIFSLLFIIPAFMIYHNTEIASLKVIILVLIPLLFWCICWIIRLMKSTDIKLLFELLSPRLINSYIIGEIFKKN